MEEDRPLLPNKEAVSVSINETTRPVEEYQQGQRSQQGAAQEHAIDMDKEKDPESVLLFGLSANPPTGRQGHAGIVQYLADMRKWDEIWVTPVYKHMHAKNSQLIAFEKRLEMCRLNFGGLRRGKTTVKVVTLEKEVAEYHYRKAEEQGVAPEDMKVGTIDVVTYAQEKHPRTAFSLTLGTDTYTDLKNNKWKRGADLMRKVSLVVVSRPGFRYTPRAQEKTDPRVLFVTVNTLSDVSSSKVRSSSDVEFVRSMVEQPVLEYMLAERLYAVGEMEVKRARCRRTFLVSSLTVLALVAGVVLLWLWAEGWDPDRAIADMRTCFDRVTWRCLKPFRRKGR